MKSREIICYNCGEVCIDRTTNKRGRFCSTKCYKQYANKRRGASLDEKMRCLYNGYVVCGLHECKNCGWNPKVELERKEAQGGNYGK